MWTTRTALTLSAALWLASCGEAPPTPAGPPVAEREAKAEAKAAARAEAKLADIEAALSRGDREAHHKQLERYLRRIEGHVETWQGILGEGTGSAEELEQLEAGVEAAKQQATALAEASEEEWQSVAAELGDELEAMEEGVAVYEARYIEVAE